MKDLKPSDITLEVRDIVIGRYDISFSYSISGGEKKEVTADHNMDPEFIRDIAKNPTKMILREIIKSLP